jgi:hypothetical protein
LAEPVVDVFVWVAARSDSIDAFAVGLIIGVFLGWLTASPLRSWLIRRETAEARRNSSEARLMEDLLALMEREPEVPTSERHVRPDRPPDRERWRPSR